MLKIKSVNLHKCVYEPKDIFTSPYGEVIFAGRSNVGKSSLINTVLNYKIAKVSSKPGKTRSINFYFINKKFFLVDLPGYGFAKVSNSERLRWKKLIDVYFSSRRNIKGAFLLIDSRVGFTENDYLMRQYFDSIGVLYSVVATKVDKLSRRERDSFAARMDKDLKGVECIFFSAANREGRKEILKSIVGMLDD